MPVPVDAGVAVHDAGPMIPDDALFDAAPPDAAPAPPDAAPAPPARIDEPEPVPPEPPQGGDAAWAILKLIGGLTILMVLAYLGGHRRVVRLQEQLGIGGVIAAGFPFLALGLIARQPEVGILTDSVLLRLQPILHFGLGWLGFIIGAQLDIRILDRVPKGTAYLILVESLWPFAVTAAAVGGSMWALGGADLESRSFWRDIIILGAAAAMTAPRRFRGFASRTWREGRGVDHLLAQLDEIVGVLGLLFVAAYFRPDVGGDWQLPGTAWVFVSIGLGVVVGVLIFAIVRVPVSNVEFFAVVLGSIAFGSGLAGYLYLSPIVVCFIAGALLTNFPCDQRDSIFNILNHLERPIHLLFLIIVGATWTVTDWHGWVLVPMFVVGRIVGKWTGMFAAKKTIGDQLPPGYADQRAMITPVSALAIALVVSVHGLEGTTYDLVTGEPVHAPFWIATVVIGGAIVNEFLVTITSPKRPAGRAPTVLPPIARDPTLPIPRTAADDLADDPGLDDEDEEDAGPVYTDPDDQGDKR